jgi:hypothetical protein
MWESLKALKENHLLSPKNLAGIVERSVLYLGRIMMETVGMTETLGWLKRKKHNSTWDKNLYTTVKTKTEHFVPTVSTPNWTLSSQKKIG